MHSLRRLLICLIVLVCRTKVLSFNIETRNPIVKKGQQQGSYFGFSVAQHVVNEGSKNQTDYWWVNKAQGHAQQVFFLQSEYTCTYLNNASRVSTVDRRRAGCNLSEKCTAKSWSRTCRREGEVRLASRPSSWLLLPTSRIVLFVSLTYG